MNKKLEESRGMRRIGQRFTIDSYIFTNLVLLKYTGDTARILRSVQSEAFQGVSMLWLC